MSGLEVAHHLYIHTFIKIQVLGFTNNKNFSSSISHKGLIVIHGAKVELIVLAYLLTSSVERVTDASSAKNCNCKG
jgi:hypothetical protein